MSKYVIYARKSTESEDRQVLSIPAQIEELRESAARSGITVSAVLEEAQSAKEPGRPKFDELMKAIDRGEIAGILCWKLDRLARNPIDGGAIMWALSKRQLATVVTPSRVFTGASDDLLLMSIEFGVSKKYIDDLSDNVKRGHRARIARGWALGIPPSGYLSDRNTHTITKDPIRYHLLRRAFDYVLASIRPSEVLSILNDQWGYRSPAAPGKEGRPLSRTAFYRLLGNPFYSGLFRSNGEIYQGRHEPMLTPEEFRQVQIMLRREGRPRSSRHEWAFTGLIRCGACSGMITAAWQRGKSGRKFPYYHCPRRNGCRQAYVLQSRVEEQFARLLERMTLHDEILAWCVKRLNDRQQQRKDRERALLASRQQTRRSLDRQLRNLTDLRIRNVVRDEDYLDQREKLLEQLRVLDRTVESVNAFEPSRAVITVLNRAKDLFVSADAQRQRRIVETICSNPRLLNGKLLSTIQKPFAIAGEGCGITRNLGRRDDVRLRMRKSLDRLVRYFEANTMETAMQAARVMGLARCLGGNTEVTLDADSKNVPAASLPSKLLYPTDSDGTSMSHGSPQA